MSKRINELIQVLEMAKDMKVSGRSNREKRAIRSVESQMRGLFYAKMDQNAKPSRKTVKYVGVELEGYTKSSFFEIMKSISVHGMGKNIAVGHDSSINRPVGHTAYEFRILMTEDNFEDIIKKFCAVMKDIGFKTNSSCGLHVHLDMRNRDYDKVLKNLFKCTPIMKKVVKSNRINNSYCSFEDDWKLQKEAWRRPTGLGGQYTVRPNRFRAINGYNAFRKHKTFEVRAHHATTDVKEITNWVKFLMAIANHKTAIRARKPKTIIDELNILRGAKTYLKSKVV